MHHSSKMTCALILSCISLMSVNVAAIEVDSDFRIDLMCYTCFYHEGHPHSDLNCLDNPTVGTLKECDQPLIPGLSYGKIPQSGSTLMGDKLCHKYSAKVDGRTIVIRGCNLELGTIKSNCTHAAFMSFDDKEVKDLEACFCLRNECNGASSKPHRNDASSSLSSSWYRLTSNLLVTTIIHSIYKFVS